jgi:hypothetical protein
MRRHILWLTAVAVCLGSALPSAHELGTTRVSAVFAADDAYDIELVTDAAALIEKLSAASGRAGSDPAEPAILLQQLDAVFRQRVTLAFDGTPAQPAIAYSVTPVTGLSASVATIRLTGTVPSGARAVRWTYGWTFASYAMTVRRTGTAEPATHWLEGGEASPEIDIAAPAPDRPAPSRVEGARTAGRYLALGFTHIVPGGLDHVLFVLGIYLLNRRLRSVVWQVSAFTVAHSITLALGMSGVVAVPPSIVEPLIALSIAYVAVENLFVAELTSRRIALVFGFGLLHGLGFAGALAELGLPRPEFLTALVTFNLGVEAGQLAIVGAAFLLVGWPWGDRDWYRRRVVVPASGAIAVTAIYWTFERVAGSAALIRTIAFIVG